MLKGLAQITKDEITNATDAFATSRSGYGMDVALLAAPFVVGVTFDLLAGGSRWTVCVLCWVFALAFPVFAAREARARKQWLLSALRFTGDHGTPGLPRRSSQCIAAHRRMTLATVVVLPSIAAVAGAYATICIIAGIDAPLPRGATAVNSVAVLLLGGGTVWLYRQQRKLIRLVGSGWHSE